jgi:serine/threonine protein kinase
MTSGVGTPAYQAPEAIEGVGRFSQYDRNVDVYSFALTAWACVNRETPYSEMRDSPWELRAKIAAGTRPAITSAFAAYPVAETDQHTACPNANANTRLSFDALGDRPPELHVGSSQQFELDLANSKGSFKTNTRHCSIGSVASLSSLEVIRQTRNTTVRSLEDIVTQGWRSEAEQRPSFEQTTPVLEVLFRMANRQLEAAKAADGQHRSKQRSRARTLSGGWEPPAADVFEEDSDGAQI